MRCFWHFFVLVFVLEGEFSLSFVWLELVELFRLYLGASLCTLLFSSCHIIFTLLGYSCWGEFILCFLFQTSY